VHGHRATGVDAAAEKLAVLAHGVERDVERRRPSGRRLESRTLVVTNPSPRACEFSRKPWSFAATIDCRSNLLERSLEISPLPSAPRDGSRTSRRRPG
jgi:hypothetical protein